MKAHHIVYKTTNTITGIYYIGIHSTDNINDGYIGSGTILKAAIKKWGRENFKREIVQVFEDRKSALCFEAELVTEELLCSGVAYNLSLGGGCVIANRKAVEIWKWILQEVYPIKGVKIIEELLTIPDERKKSMEYFYELIPNWRFARIYKQELINHKPNGFGDELSLKISHWGVQRDTLLQIANAFTWAYNDTKQKKETKRFFSTLHHLGLVNLFSIYERRWAEIGTPIDLSRY